MQPTHPKPACESFLRPMIGMETTKAITGRSEDDLLAAINSGAMRWAFDLSAGRRTRRKKNFVRIWIRSVDCYRYPRQFTQPRALDQFLEAFLPSMSREQGYLMGTTLQKLLNVSGNHIRSLIRVKVLRTLRWVRRVGPRGTPRIKRWSVEAMLRSRCVNTGTEALQNIAERTLPGPRDQRTSDPILQTNSKTRTQHYEHDYTIRSRTPATQTNKKPNLATPPRRCRKQLPPAPLRHERRAQTRVSPAQTRAQPRLSRCRSTQRAA